MEKNYSVLAPGPVNLHPAVREALSQPMIHHRTPEFDQILQKALSGLKKVFQTEQHVFILSSTGSGGMEALMVNTLQPGDEIIIVDSGKFGERWVEMAQTFGYIVHRLKIPWGKSVEPEQITTMLDRYPQTQAVFCQACETSTGALHPLQKISKSLKAYPQVLFFVDGITAVGAMNVPMDNWGIDGIVAGSQKAFMLPTGLSFVSLSAKAWKRCESISTPRFYFDLRKEKKANDKGETFFSSNVAYIRALTVVLDDIFINGLNSLFHTIHQRAERTRSFVRFMGLNSYCEHPSDSVTAFLVPSGMDSQKLREQLEKEKGITIMGGQDEAKGKILRIGHMGYILDSDMDQLFSALFDLLKDSVGRSKTDFENWKTSFTV